MRAVRVHPKLSATVVAGLLAIAFGTLQVVLLRRRDIGDRSIESES